MLLYADRTAAIIGAKLDVPGSAFVALELDLALLDPGNTIVEDSTGPTGLEVVHVRLPAAGAYEVQVSLKSGPAGAPYRLAYRILPE